MSIEEHPAHRYRAHEGAIFSSSKCPSSAESSSTCELPFGFVWSPMAVAPPSANYDPPVPKELLPGTICVTCLAYINLYCELKEKNVWTCPFCKCDNVASDGTDEKFLIAPQMEFRQSLSADPPASTLKRETVVIVLDGNLPSSEATAVGRVLQNLEYQYDSLGLLVFGKTVHLYQLGLSTAGMALCDTVCSHRGMTEERWKQGCYMGTTIESLLTCIAAQFGSWGDDTSSSLAPMSRLQMLKERKEARIKRKNRHDQDDVQSSGNGISNGDTYHLPRSPWVTARERAAASAPQYRCTGEAIQCAIDMVSVAAADDMDSTKTARILLFTNGCPNLGSGSVVDSAITESMSETTKSTNKALFSTVDTTKLARASEFFELVAKGASEAGIGIDVFCTGSSELGLPAYQSLVEPSSGYVLSHDTFTSKHLERNIGFLLNHTCLSLAHFVEDVVEDADGGVLDTSERQLPSHSASWIDGCIVDIRMSRSVCYLDVNLIFSTEDSHPNNRLLLFLFKFFESHTFDWPR
jgi:Sec23/Sec24 trunk domain/Sec23/Sec24 zinc finger